MEPREDSVVAVPADEPLIASVDTGVITMLCAEVSTKMNLVPTVAFGKLIVIAAVAEVLTKDLPESAAVNLALAEKIFVPS